MDVVVVLMTLFLAYTMMYVMDFCDNGLAIDGKHILY